MILSSAVYALDFCRLIRGSYQEHRLVKKTFSRGREDQSSVVTFSLAYLPRLCSPIKSLRNETLFGVLHSFGKMVNVFAQVMLIICFESIITWIWVRPCCCALCSHSLNLQKGHICSSKACNYYSFILVTWDVWHIPQSSWCRTCFRSCRGKRFI